MKKIRKFSHIYTFIKKIHFPISFSQFMAKFFQAKKKTLLQSTSTYSIHTLNTQKNPFQSKHIHQ
jgi:hypothetical protein